MRKFNLRASLEAMEQEFPEIDQSLLALESWQDQLTSLTEMNSPSTSLEAMRASLENPQYIAMLIGGIIGAIAAFLDYFFHKKRIERMRDSREEMKRTFSRSGGEYKQPGIAAKLAARKDIQSLLSYPIIRQAYTQKSHPMQKAFTEALGFVRIIPMHVTGFISTINIAGRNAEPEELNEALFTKMGILDDQLKPVMDAIEKTKLVEVNNTDVRTKIYTVQRFLSAMNLADIDADEKATEKEAETLINKMNHGILWIKCNGMAEQLTAEVNPQKLKKSQKALIKIKDDMEKRPNNGNLASIEELLKLTAKMESLFAAGMSSAVKALEGQDRLWKIADSEIKKYNSSSN